MEIWKQTVLPAVLAGTEVWVPTCYEELEKEQRIQLKEIGGLSKSHATSPLLIDMAVLRIESEMKKIIANFTRRALEGNAGDKLEKILSENWKKPDWEETYQRL